MCQESLTIELGSFSVLQTHLDTFHKSDIKVEDHAIEDMDFEIKYEEEDKVNENPVVIPIKNMSKHMKNMNIQLPNPMVKCDICGNDLKRGSLLNHKKLVHHHHDCVTLGQCVLFQHSNILTLLYKWPM